MAPKKQAQQREYHVYAHDGMGAYAGMENFTASSPDEAIEMGKRHFKNVPEICNKWVASTDRADIRSGRRS